MLNSTTDDGSGTAAARMPLTSLTIPTPAPAPEISADPEVPYAKISNVRMNMPEDVTPAARFGSEKLNMISVPLSWVLDAVEGLGRPDSD